jgi:Asp-tRNAAsn/Glu-tRNAGln amidotransferase A subunit and related amidases
VQKAYEQSLQSFQDLGAIIKEIAIPEIHDATPITLTIALAEAGYVHKDNIAKRLAEFGDDIRPMFSITGDLKALDYIDALKAQHRIRLQFSQVFDTVDILCVPTIPITPPLIGQEEITWTDGTETVFDTMIRFTGFFNLTGNPVLAVPSGTSGEGLPSGIQLVAHPWKRVVSA